MDQTIRLDAKKRDSSFCEERIYPLRRGERNNVVLTVQVRADGAPYDLTGKEARLVGTTADGKLIGPCPLEISDAKAGTGSLTLPASMYSAVGTTHAYIEVREGETIVETTDSFACKVLECADMDAEQAEEYTPLLGELQDAIASARASEVRGATAVTLETGSPATAIFRDSIIEIGVPKGERGDKGDKGDKGEPFTYDDFTESQIAELQRPATEAAAEAKAAIAEVKATEAKLYPAAENTLKGKVKDTFVHVDDAFPSSLLGIEVEGACKQDGTPSPDNPVPIEVIENPVLKVQGRNFAEATNVSTNKDIYSGVLFVEADIKPSENYILSFDVDTGGNRYYLNESLFTYIDFGVKKGKNYVQCRTVESISKSNPAQYCTVPKQKGWILLKNSKAQTNDVQFSNVQLERGSTVSDYAPYVGTSQSFTLPAEHPYLAKLPDGTADEIVVDRDGNVELVARTYRQTLNNWNETSNKYFICQLDVPRVGNSGLSTIGDISDREIAGVIWCGLAMGFVAYTPISNETVESMKAMQIEAYVHVAEQRYSLGKIEMPKAQDSIVNAWTDAEVTPNTSIEYTRDVNIVVANLESAIASITQS